MDFDLFMERYGYTVLLIVLGAGSIVGIFALLGYNLVKIGHFTIREALAFLLIVMIASLIAAYFGKFMNTLTTVASRVGYHYRAKVFEDKKKLEREREKLREEGGKLY